ncbi:MAG: PHB depolymerase family esterase [Anaerolineales bacterium]|jgi:polyhydroxybutyrate depolymerase
MRFARILSKLILGIGIVAVMLTAGIYFGVGKAPTCLFPANGPAKPGLSTRVLYSNGIKRCYLLYIPVGYTASKPKPVVFALHGLAGNARGFLSMTGWNELAEREGFLVVYPHGSSFPLRWNTSPAFRIEHIDDVQFIEDILIKLSEIANIDGARIYGNGFSQGATFTEMIACDLADRLAAVGMVEGYGDTDRLNCDLARPLPLIALIGTADVLGEPEDYPQWFYDLMNLSPDPRYIEDLPFDVWRDLWIADNGCDPRSVDEKSSGEVHLVHYNQCAEGTEIQLYWLEGAGHTWPGGKNYALFEETSDAVDATEVIWAFFEAHSLPDRYIQK